MDLWTQWKSTALYSRWTWLLITMKWSSSQLVPHPPGSQQRHGLLSRLIPSERKGAPLLTCNLAARGSIWCHPRTAFRWHLVILLQDFTHRSRRNKAELKRISRSNLQAGMLVKAGLDMGQDTLIRRFQRVLNTEAIIKDPVQTKGAAVEAPLARVCIAKGFSKTAFPPLFNCY